jgi:hypothetical protein
MVAPRPFPAGGGLARGGLLVDPTTALRTHPTDAATGSGARRAPRLLHRLRGLLGEAALLLLAVWLVPVVILLIGLPIALLARLLIAIAGG